MKKIRKVYSGVVPNGKVLNTKNDSLQDTYSSDYLNRAIPDTQDLGEIVVDDIICKNLCSGSTQNYFINLAATTSGLMAGNSGLAIPVDGGYYTISTTITQERYRIGCVNTLPTTESGNTLYKGINKDGTKESITIDTTGYSYLIVNATDLTKIQVEKGPVATGFVEHRDFDNTKHTLYENSGGTELNITLNDDINNYKEIEIFFRERKNYANSIKVRIEDANYINLSVIFNDDTYTYIVNKNISISGNSLTTGKAYRIVFGENDYQVYQSTNMSIYKIVGYKQ